jgi:hypothetical protein
MKQQRRSLRQELRAPAPRATPRFRIPVLATLAALLIVFLAPQLSIVLSIPFSGDDLLFLRKARDSSFGALWGLRDLAFHYWRPWSRELHYWWLERMFGFHEPPFHLVSLGLWIAAIAGYFVTVRRTAGGSVAGLATAAVTLLASWGVLLMWIAGAQDLWMLAFGFAFLATFIAGRTIPATLLYSGALMSKETAAMFALIAAAHLLVVERRSIADAARRLAPMALVTVAWAAFHPLIGGRLRGAVRIAELPGLHLSPGAILGLTLRSAVNLVPWPHPRSGWTIVVLAASAGIVVALAILFLGRHAGRGDDGRGRVDPERRKRLIAFGAIWTACGWAPLFSPSVGWHAYYGLLGTMGAWLVIAVLLEPNRRVAYPLLIALGIAGGGASATRSNDWGTVWYQSRAADFVRRARDFFHVAHPSFPPHSRIFLGDVPPRIGLMPGGGNSPVMQIWYRDSTLRTYFISEYRPRDAREPGGPDYFFSYDSSASAWSEHPELAPETPGAPDEKAERLFQLHQYTEAARLYEALVKESPDRFDYIFNVGSCHLHLGDSAAAARWYVRAAAFPEAPEGMRRVARKYQRFLR